MEEFFENGNYQNEMNDNVTIPTNLTEQVSNIYNRKTNVEVVSRYMSFSYVRNH